MESMPLTRSAKIMNSMSRHSPNSSKRLGPRLADISQMDGRCAHSPRKIAQLTGSEKERSAFSGVKPPDRCVASSVCRGLGPFGDIGDTLLLSVGPWVIRPAAVNIAPPVLPLRRAALIVEGHHPLGWT